MWHLNVLERIVLDLRECDRRREFEEQRQSEECRGKRDIGSQYTGLDLRD